MTVPIVKKKELLIICQLDLFKILSYKLKKQAEMSGSTVGGSQRSIREQFVGLQVDLEDKEKIGQLLAQRIEQYRQDLSQVDHDIRDHYKRILHEETEKHKVLASDLTEKTQELMKKKSDLLKECKEIMAFLQNKEQDVQAEIRALYREAERDLESTRKQFKLTSDERLQKYLQQKAQEYKESTSKAMEPEFLRLQQMHEHEILDINLYFSTEERKLQDTLKQQLQNQIEDMKQSCKEDFQITLQQIQDLSTQQLEESIRKHQQHLHQLQQRHEDDMNKLQQSQQDKLVKQRKAFFEEIAFFQSSSNNRLLDMKKQHRQQIDTLQQEHESQVKALQQQVPQEKNRLMKKGKNPKMDINKKDRFSDDDYSSEEDERKKKERRSRPNSASGTSRKSPYNNISSNKRGNLDGDDELGPRTPLSPSKIVSKDLLNSATNPSVLEDLANSLSLSYQCQYNEVKKTAQEQRNADLQSEIRALEKEMLQIERECQQRLQQERNKIEQLEVKEEANLSQICQSLQVEISHIHNVKTLLVDEVKNEEERLSQYQSEKQRLSEEIVIYQNGILAHKKRVADKEEQTRLFLSAEKSQQQVKIQSLQDEYDRLLSTIRRQTASFDTEIAELKESQSKELHNLHAQVKDEVERREQEIIKYREMLEEVDAKVYQVRMLIERYQKRKEGGGGEGSNSTTSNGHGNRNGPAGSGASVASTITHATRRTTATHNTVSGNSLSGMRRNNNLSNTSHK